MDLDSQESSSSTDLAFYLSQCPFFRSLNCIEDSAARGDGEISVIVIQDSVTVEKVFNSPRSC